MVKFRSLNCHLTELAGMCSFENLVKMDMVLSSSETKDQLRPPSGRLLKPPPVWAGGLSLLSQWFSSPPRR